MKEEKNTHIIVEMKEHLEHILLDINKILEDDSNKYIIDNINEIKLNIVSLKEKIITKEDLLMLDLKALKKLSNMIYDLNYNNNFSTLTDHISNELFAFEFLLQEELKKQWKKGRKYQKWEKISMVTNIWWTLFKNDR